MTVCNKGGSICVCVLSLGVHSLSVAARQPVRADEPHKYQHAHRGKTGCMEVLRSKAKQPRGLSKVSGIHVLVRMVL